MTTLALTPSNLRQKKAFSALLGHSKQRPTLPQALLLQGSLEQNANTSPLDFGWALATAVLCQTPNPDNSACTHCASCLLMRAKTHPDFLFLAPQTVLQKHNWSAVPVSENIGKKRKPSKEIRIESILECITFAQRTPARARGKVVLAYPAESMNTISTNALLKTLEEPPAGLYFILATLAPHLLLPTIKSRCCHFRLDTPSLGSIKTIESAESAVSHLPKTLAAGQTTVLDHLAPTQAVQQCLCLCHDLMCAQSAAPVRFFRAQDLPPVPPLKQLARWYKQLAKIMQSIEHPYREDLFKEYLAALAQQALVT